MADAAHPNSTTDQTDETRPVRAAEPATSGPAATDDSNRTAADYNDVTERPAADHPGKVEKPTDLKRPSVMLAVRRSVREFLDDEGTDRAAALTYYSVLAIFPAAIALMSLLGVVGQGKSSLHAVQDVLRPLLSPGTFKTVNNMLVPLATSQAAGIALVVGIVGALLSASGYVGAFGRAMNRVYEVEEGRPIWVLRPLQFAVTLATVLMCAAGLVILVVSGPVADSVGNRLGVGSSALTVWNIAKRPVLIVIVVLIVALLYYATPNVKQPHIRWISVGAFVAIVIWLVASAGFAFYVAHFGSYNKTYGAVAGGVVALLWLWLTNVALLFGAELDSELERSRQLQSGIAAEETLQLPLRDDKGVLKADQRREKAVARARDLRERFTHKGDVGDRPFK
jgi:membrane protein